MINSLLRQAMLIAIGQKLKAECDPPTDLTPELRNILRRLEEQKENEKWRPRKSPGGAPSRSIVLNCGYSIRWYRSDGGRPPLTPSALDFAFSDFVAIVQIDPNDPLVA